MAFCKLGINSSGASSSHASPDTVPLLNEDDIFENMASEIDTLLSKVCDENNEKKIVFNSVTKDVQKSKMIFDIF